MNILTIDTSDSYDSLTLYDSEKGILADLSFSIPKLQSEGLIDILKVLFEGSKFSLKDIDIVGVCIGPGSYTGTRIGIASAMGISEGSKAQCYGVSSLEIQAYSLKNEKREIVSFKEIRDNQFFYGRYKIVDGELLVLEKDRKISRDSFVDYISSCRRGVAFVGEGELDPSFEVQPIDKSLTKSLLMSKILANCRKKESRRSMDLLYL